MQKFGIHDVGCLAELDGRFSDESVEFNNKLEEIMSNTNSGSLDSLSIDNYFQSYIRPRNTHFIRRGPSLPTVTILQTFLHKNTGVPLKPRNSNVAQLAQERDKEKRELAQLNDKFANYVERVHFLEVHNKKLEMELNNLKSKAGDEPNKIRQMYETEIKEAKNLIKETEKDKINAELKADSCVNDVNKLKKRLDDTYDNRNADRIRIDDLFKEITDNEAEISLIKRRIEDINEETRRYKQDAQRLLDEMKKIANELDSETLKRLQFQNEKDLLSEELDYINKIHQQEMDELRRKMFYDPGVDSSQFFKSELTNAIREIRQEFDKKNAEQHCDIEQWYKIQIQRTQLKKPEPADNLIAREETRRLRTAVSDQRRDIANMKARNSEMETRIKELEELFKNEQKEGQDLVDSKDAQIADLNQRKKDLLEDYNELTKMKANLQDEIYTYRILLEGEGQQEGLKQVLESSEARANQNRLNAIYGLK
ncbi:unnamed protein product [Brachionus calyciflorus]|uniref:IF rod domain-containing protein n=1 Tax=Brachionus calyciflorus TaxID=104777 RepID=A0A814A216_9BILA|nr:unnamed protein product [Brachionus calyciflorus]